MIRKNLIARFVGVYLGFISMPAMPGQTVSTPSLDPSSLSAGAPQELNKWLRDAKASAVLQERQDYRLGPGDVVDISVFDIKELTRTLEISANGKITLPFINEVPAEGLTTQELEQSIARMLEAKVMKNPQVSVAIKEYRSQPIHLLGAVQKPGTYQVVRKLHLIDALSLAGGFTDKAGPRILLRKASAPGAHGAPTSAGSSGVLDIDVRQLLVDADATLNYPIEAGDVISVPLRVDKVFYVLGDVGKPGAYEFKDKDEEVRLSQAIATAGGLLRTAAVKEVTVVRADLNGKKSYLTVNVQQVLNGKRDDLALKPNDLVFVPNSSTKSATQAIINGLSNIVTAGIVVLR